MAFNALKVFCYNKEKNHVENKDYILQYLALHIKHTISKNYYA